MIGKILIITAAVYGAIQLFFTNDKYARIILSVQILSIGITFLGFPRLKTIGFFLFVLCFVGTMLYTILRVKSEKKKLLIHLIVLPVLISFTFRFMNWPGGFLLSMLMLLPIVAFIILLFSSVKSRNEIGFLAIITSDAIIQFSQVVLAWIL